MKKTLTVLAGLLVMAFALSGCVTTMIAGGGIPEAPAAPQENSILLCKLESADGPEKLNVPGLKTEAYCIKQFNGSNYAYKNEKPWVLFYEELGGITKISWLTDFVFSGTEKGLLFYVLTVPDNTEEDGIREIGRYQYNTGDTNNKKEIAVSAEDYETMKRAGIGSLSLYWYFPQSETGYEYAVINWIVAKSAE